METWRNIDANMKKVLYYANKKIMVLDIESTGLGEKAKIIQFAGDLIDMKEGCIIARGNIYINPEEPLSPKIKELTGLTDEILESKETEQTRIPYILQYLAKADVLVGHNIAFDFKMLQQACHRLQITMPEFSCLDTIELARDFIPPTETENYKLETIYRYINPEKRIRFHNAKGDVEATTEILLWCMEQYVEQRNQSAKLGIEKHVEYCYYWENPHKKSQKRLKVVFNKDKTDPQNKYIYWDCVQHCWSHSSERKAQQLFAAIDKANLEEQILHKYAWLDNPKSIDVLAKQLKERQKNRK